MRIVLALFLSILISFSGAATSGVLALSSSERFRSGNDILFSNKDASDSISGDFVYYSQLNPNWANKPYNYTETDEANWILIGNAGCGPTSLAMIIATTINSSVTPVEVAELGYDNGSLVIGTGTDHSLLFKAAQKEWGVRYVDMSGDSMEQIMLFVESGGYIYMAGTGPEPFTEDGHVIVIKSADVTANTVTVADPYREDNTIYSVDEIDASRTLTYGVSG